MVRYSILTYKGQERFVVIERILTLRGGRYLFSCWDCDLGMKVTFLQHKIEGIRPA